MHICNMYIDSYTYFCFYKSLKANFNQLAGGGFDCSNRFLIIPPVFHLSYPHLSTSHTPRSLPEDVDVFTPARLGHFSDEDADRSAQRQRAHPPRTHLLALPSSPPDFPGLLPLVDYKLLVSGIVRPSFLTSLPRGVYSISTCGSSALNEPV